MELASFGDLLQALTALVTKRVCVRISPRAGYDVLPPTATFEGVLVRGGTDVTPLAPVLADTPGESTCFLVRSDQGEYVGVFTAIEVLYAGGSAMPGEEGEPGAVTYSVRPRPNSEPTIEVRVGPPMMGRIEPDKGTPPFAELR
jgi:hypothetical protein